jgi:soluble lytic murein transglycosylase
MSTKHGTLSAMKIHSYIWVCIVLTIATVSCSQATTGKIDISEPSATVAVKTTVTTPSPNIIEKNTISSLNISNTNNDTSTSSETLTPAHNSINAGQIALRNSNWQAAIDSYIVALEQTEEEDAIHLDAHLGLAHSYLRSKAMSTALETLETLLEDHPTAHNMADAIFLLGLTNHKLGNHTIAIEYFNQYLEQYSNVIDSYVLELIGDAHRSLAKYSTSADYYKAAILKPRGTNINFLLLDKAEVLQAAGKTPESISLLDLVATNTKYDNTRAQMDYKRAQAMVAANQINTAIQYYKHAVNTYPESYYSYLSLVELLSYGTIVNEFQRGLIYYHADQHTPAILAFRRYLSTNPEHDAQAHYYMALSYRNLDNIPAAKLHFQEIIDAHTNDPLWGEAWLELAYTQWGWEENYSGAVSNLKDMVSTYPNHSVTPEILFYAARIAERGKYLDTASALWGQVADKYATTNLAPEAAFLSGITFYRQDKFDEAERRFSQSIDLNQGDYSQLSSSLVWLGKVHSINGNTELAGNTWLKAIDTDESGYYGIRATQLLNGHLPFHPVPNVNFTLASSLESRIKAEDYIAQHLDIQNKDLSSLSDKLMSDEHWTRGSTLWRLGQFEDAREELDNLSNNYKSDAVASYQLSLAYNELGYYYGAIWAARYCMDSLELYNNLEAPKFITQLRYGPYYLDLIHPISKQYGLDPLIVASLIRQESLYQGEVTSSAYAQGLMQVIPPTGEYIARQLRWHNYQTKDLYRPHINVAFGVYYLDEQLGIFNGNKYAALAAYNAGPGNTSIWNKLAKNDYDLLVEVIRLDEPQEYIRRIVQHYSVYHHLYVD